LRWRLRGEAGISGLDESKRPVRGYRRVNIPGLPGDVRPQGSHPAQPDICGLTAIVRSQLPTLSACCTAFPVDVRRNMS
jgi:hypothetical protein